MQVTASAPGKAILFGEHAVVYGKPAIAMAINKRTQVKLSPAKENKIKVNIRDLKINGYIDPKNNSIITDSNKKGILKYILCSLKKVHDLSGLNINIDVNIPIGGGLGSSAAVTVALIAALSKYNDLNLKKRKIAKLAHEVELEVQNSASPIDTSISTYGGLIYLKKDSRDILSLDINQDIPVVIGYTRRRGDTGKLVEEVKLKKMRYPEIINPILDSIEDITNKACKAIRDNNEERIGELMNINHGLLDALGVNTYELSNMVYAARKAGALGSKITGAGGGGSIVSYSPYESENVLNALNQIENGFITDISTEGVKTSVEVKN